MIRPVGPVPAKIVLVGECPGEQEEKEGVPFVGQSGKLLDSVLEEVGIPRAMCYITNVVLERPKDNNFLEFYEKGKPTGKLQEAYQRLYNELASVNPNVIVALGNEALKALTGNTGILNWRGSIIPTMFGKVIPTIHPAAILRDWTVRPAVVADFGKVLDNAEDKEIRIKKRNLITNPSFEEVMRYVQEAKTKEWVAFDIETETEQITCISFATSSDEGICVPFWFGASGSHWSKEEELKIWEEIKLLLEGECPRKIAQNGMYDMEYLRHTVGIHVKLHLDTMLAFHTLYSELPKDLGYLCSIYTDHPYYKYQRTSDSMATLWRYNATDAVITYECAMAINTELKEAGLEQYYYQRIHTLINPLLDMQFRGVRFDVDGRDRLRKQYRYDISLLQHQLEQLVGYPLNVSSSKQMLKWLYEDLKLPKKTKKRKATGEDTLSADEDTLDELFKLVKDERVKEAFKKIFEIREKSKILSTYLDVKLDRDHRIRCSYLIGGTETGRLSSRSTSRGTGTNLQNIPSGVVKRLFLADEGKLLINADLSQAEARIVAYLSGETRLIKVFEEGGDIHRKNAANIFGIEESRITDEQRQLAKRVVHASNYGMGPRTFANTAGISVAESTRLLNQYFATYPRIKLWQMNVQAQLKKSRVLVNPFGRKRVFFNRWGESLVKEGLAFLPQSTVADIINEAVVRMYGKFGLTAYHSGGLYAPELLLQVHDSIVVQTPEDQLDDTIAIMRACMNVPVEINGKFLTIPVDFKIGRNWQELEKYNQRTTSTV